MISQEALDEVLSVQRSDGRRLGTLLVERGHINEIQLTQILSHQLAVPWVSLLHIEFSRQLLDLVPRNVAERYCLVPIYVRHVRRQGDTLYVAMDDPTNEEALRECEAGSGLPVRAMIAPPSDVRHAIRVYYGASVRPESPGAASEPPSTMPDLNALTAAAAMSDAPEIAVSESTVDDDLAASEELEEATSRKTLESIPSEELIEASRSEPPSAVEEEPPSSPDSGVRAAVGTIPPAAPTMPSAEEQDAPPSSPTRPTGSSPGLSPPMAALLGAVLGPSSSSAAASSDAAPPSAPRSAPGSAPGSRPRPDITASGPASSRRGEPRPVPVPEPEGSVPLRIPSPRAKPRRMIALTLLDGTTIHLPARGRRDAPPESTPDSEEPVLTARDLVAALRAVSQGADASEVLGKDARWEAMFAALLSLLLKKHLIADWEFVEELRKM